MFRATVPVSKRVLFAVHDWGLGHATRSLPLIRALLDRGDTVTVLVAPGNALRLLQAELGDRCAFYPYADIPKPFSRFPALFYLRMSLSMPQVMALFRREHELTEKLVKERDLDCVVSDTRYGIWSQAVPSYCILHSLRQLIPFRPHWLERLVERSQCRKLSGFTKVLIPDMEEDGGLSGELSHDLDIDWGAGRLEWIGPLSGVRVQPGKRDIDMFFSISGIEPQRTIFERKVLDALPQLTGRIVVTLGQPARADECIERGNATIHGCLDRHAQADMLNRARITITRSGYTTLMELAELGGRALLVPTPGQSEQEYLARLHRERGRMWSTTQSELDLPADLERAANLPGLPRVSSAASIQRFLDIIG